MLPHDQATLLRTHLPHGLGQDVLNVFVLDDLLVLVPEKVHVGDVERGAVQMRGGGTGGVLVPSEEPALAFVRTKGGSNIDGILLLPFCLQVVVKTHSYLLQKANGLWSQVRERVLHLLQLIVFTVTEGHKQPILHQRIFGL